MGATRILLEGVSSDWSWDNTFVGRWLPEGVGGVQIMFRLVNWDLRCCSAFSVHLLTFGQTIKWQMEAGEKRDKNGKRGGERGGERKRRVEGRGRRRAAMKWDSDQDKKGLRGRRRKKKRWTKRSGNDREIVEGTQNRRRIGEKIKRQGKETQGNGGEMKVCRMLYEAREFRSGWASSSQAGEKNTEGKCASYGLQDAL